MPGIQNPQVTIVSLNITVYAEMFFCEGITRYGFACSSCSGFSPLLSDCTSLLLYRLPLTVLRWNEDEEAALALLVQGPVLCATAYCKST